MRQVNRLWSVIGLTVVLGFALRAFAEESAPVDLAKLAAEAVSDDLAIAQPAIAGLREAGPQGLIALVAAHRPLVEKAISEPDVVKADAGWHRLQAALDAVGAQHDCYASGLYWYTDLESAKDAAGREGKPILSLRLLGNLTDELSCANSRFFRTVLYANHDVSRVLRERFILHWQSVRPVPKVTIDFGDGRKLVRTLTGNSIHYVLDAEGRPIDALPGLYGPQAFLRGLDSATAIAKKVADLNEADRQAALKNYHDAAAEASLAAWGKDLEQIGITLDRQADGGALAAATNDTTWGRIAALHAADAQLDAASVSFIRSQNPTAARATKLTMSKAMVEDPLVRIVRSFQNTVAIDTMQNEYTFHRQIHEWFAGGKITTDEPVDQLNDRVYAELFLTPSSDPWLGLLPPGAYTALSDDGVCAVP